MQNSTESASAIPTPSEVSAEWLTERLRSAGHSGAEVRGFSAARIGTGQIGLCIRYQLDLAAGGPDTPRSLVGKFPSEDPTSRATGVQLRNYLKEVMFYRELDPRLPVNTPRCYYADIIEEGPEFMVLLEDLAPALPGNQLVGCDATVARAAALELVGLHGASWNDQGLRGLEWLGEPDQDSRENLRTLYRELLPGFLERYGAHLSSEEATIIAQVGDAPAAPLFDALGTPFSLVHVDYRLDNLLIDAGQQPPRIAVVDWQSITLGSPLSDLAYFLGAGMLPEPRREAEQDIVREYHNALVARGIGDYPWERCWHDYRRGTFAGFGVTVIASMLVQQTQRGDAMFTAMAQRHARHALDHDAGSLLG